SASASGRAGSPVQIFADFNTRSAPADEDSGTAVSAAIMASADSIRASLFQLSGGRRRPDALLRERGAGGGQPRDRDAERRARHVVQARVMEELDRARVAAVLAADAHLQLRLDLAAAPRAHRD